MRYTVGFGERFFLGHRLDTKNHKGLRADVASAEPTMQPMGLQMLDVVAVEYYTR